MGLVISLYNRDLDNPELMHVVHYPVGLTFSSVSQGGFIECSFSWGCTPTVAVEWYQNGFFRRAVVSDEAGFIAFEGRVERIALRTSGIGLVVMGYYSNLFDKPYNQANGMSPSGGVWQNESRNRLTPVFSYSGTNISFAGHSNQSIAATTRDFWIRSDPLATGDWGAIGWSSDWDCDGTIKRVDFEPDVVGGNTTFYLYFVKQHTTYSATGMPNGTNGIDYELVWAYSGGPLPEASKLVSARTENEGYTRIYWLMTVNTTSRADWSFRGVKINTMLIYTVTEDNSYNYIIDIVKKCGFQIKHDWSRIYTGDTYRVKRGDYGSGWFGLDEYTDRLPAIVIEDLCKIGVGAGAHPKEVKFAVWEDRMPVFDLKRTTPNWYAFREDLVGDMGLEKTADDLWNAVIITSQAEYGGSWSEGTTYADMDSIVKWGFSTPNSSYRIRHFFTSAVNTDAGWSWCNIIDGNRLAQMELNEKREPQQHGNITLKRVRDIDGNIHPVYEVRGGDMVQIVDLHPDTMSFDSTDSQRSFYIEEAVYDNTSREISLSLGRGTQTTGLVLARLAKYAGMYQQKIN